MEQLEIIKYQEIIKTTLTPIYGEGEANSMALYYTDALKAMNESITEGRFVEDMHELKSGVPVQYVVGLSFFYGYEFYLNNEVLIPRAETEELVYWAVSDYKNLSELSILDIGSGSGCILISSLLELNNSHGVAWDISPKAIECVQSNAKKYNVNVNAKLIDVLKYKWGNQSEKFDIVFCNPPYILHDENKRMGENVLAHEPHIALFVEGNDPLVFYKTIIDNISHITKASGVIYFETSDLYHEELETYLIDRNLTYEFRKDMQGAWRMLKLRV